MHEPTNAPADPTTQLQHFDFQRTTWLVGALSFAVLGVMTYFAKRNVKPEDDESGKEGS